MAVWGRAINSRKINRRASRWPSSIETIAALLMSLVALWALLELSEEVAERDTRQVDLGILLWIRSTSPGWLDGPIRIVTAFGYAWLVTPLLLVAAYVFYRKGLRLSAMLVLLSVSGASSIGLALKSLYERGRPELSVGLDYMAGFYSYPSGHAITAVSFYGVLAVLTARHLTGRTRWTVVGLGAIFALLLGFSRLYLGVHYPSDVVAGYLVGTIWFGTLLIPPLVWRSLGELRGGR